MYIQNNKQSNTGIWGKYRAYKQAKNDTKKQARKSTNKTI